MGQPPPPPPPLAAFTGILQDLQLALPLPFRTFQARVGAYVPALQAALASQLSLETSDIWVVSARAGSYASTVVSFDIALPASSSDTSSDGGAASPRLLRQFSALFGARDGLTTSVGDAAGPELVAALRQFGLPVSGAFYYDAGAPSIRRRLRAMLTRRA